MSSRRFPRDWRILSSRAGDEILMHISNNTFTTTLFGECPQVWSLLVSILFLPWSGKLNLNTWLFPRIKRDPETRKQNWAWVLILSNTEPACNTWQINSLYKSGFHLSVVKPKPKTSVTEKNISHRQSNNTCCRCQERENTCRQVTICFVFTFYWLIKWREIF